MEITSMMLSQGMVNKTEKLLVSGWLQNTKQQALQIQNSSLPTPSGTTPERLLQSLLEAGNANFNFLVKARRKKPPTCCVNMLGKDTHLSQQQIPQVPKSATLWHLAKGLSPWPQVWSLSSEQQQKRNRNLRLFSMNSSQKLRKINLNKGQASNLWEETQLRLLGHFNAIKN